MSIQLSDKTTVRELVGRHPATRQVFEEHGIDYCCGGGKCLADAARESGIDLAGLTADLQKVLRAEPTKKDQGERDWFAAPLGELAQHILDKHHVYMHSAMPRIRELLKKVLRAHGANHGAMLQEVQRLFAGLDEEIAAHLMKEEQVLFPYIQALDDSAREGTSRPKACFDSVRAPIQQMEREHENAGQALEQIGAVTEGYTLPEDACPTFSALYEELQRMGTDLHEHIHLENNILFPRAIEMEGAA